ncbi:MAG: hypothetical protein KIT14_22640 [bacterium]|nr:hypothetical protein [bacterium]
MTGQLQVHGVIAVRAEALITSHTTFGPYVRRRLVIETADGSEMTIVLFAEKPTNPLAIEEVPATESHDEGAR